MKSLFWFALLFFSTQLTAGMREDLTYLASDDLKGRRPGTPENLLAVKYLENQLKQAGLMPLGGSYKQDFTIFTRMIKEGRNLVAFNNHKGAFEPLSFSASGDLHNRELVFVGYGISIAANDPQLVYDDYRGIDVKGKVVVFMTGDPGIGNPDSLFRDPVYMNYQSLIYKLKNAARHGAVGALVVQDPMSLSDPQNEPALYFNDREGGGERFEVVAGMTTNQWINSLMLKGSILDWQRKISATQTPKSFSLELKIELSVHLKKQTGRVSNVLAFLPGSDPQLKREIIVLGAHFDHLGMGGQSSMEPGHEPKIHNGADDNASGTAMVLELARRMAKRPSKRSVLFALFNAEEMGLLGSAHMVSAWEGLSSEYGDLYGMLNFDMVGRFNKKVSLMGTATAFEWKDILKALPGQRKLPVEATRLAVGSSDHASFIQSEIPALFFTTGAHADYHRASDDVEKIDFKAMQRLINYGEGLVHKLVDGEVLTFDPDSLQGQDPGRNRGYGAHLGCVPQFGQSDDIVGVVCTRTVPHSPAHKAGLSDGDVIVQIGDIEIKSIYDLAFALRFYRPGDVVTLGWRHGEEVIRKQISLTRRGEEKGMHQHCHHPPIL